jgi:hypothetical protein
MKMGFGTDLLGPQHVRQFTEFTLRAQALPAIAPRYPKMCGLLIGAARGRGFTATTRTPALIHAGLYPGHLSEIRRANCAPRNTQTRSRHRFSNICCLSTVLMSLRKGRCGNYNMLFRLLADLCAQWLDHGGHIPIGLTGLDSVGKAHFRCFCRAKFDTQSRGIRTRIVKIFAHE